MVLLLSIKNLPRQVGNNTPRYPIQLRPPNTFRGSLLRVWNNNKKSSASYLSYVCLPTYRVWELTNRCAAQSSVGGGCIITLLCRDNNECTHSEEAPETTIGECVSRLGIVTFSNQSANRRVGNIFLLSRVSFFILFFIKTLVPSNLMNRKCEEIQNHRTRLFLVLIDFYLRFEIRYFLKSLFRDFLLWIITGCPWKTFIVVVIQVVFALNSMRQT